MTFLVPLGNCGCKPASTLGPGEMTRGSGDSMKVNTPGQKPRGHTLGVRSLTQSCPILYEPADCSSPGSSIHGTLQARTLECVAMNGHSDAFLEAEHGLGRD